MTVSNERLRELLLELLQSRGVVENAPKRVQLRLAEEIAILSELIELRERYGTVEIQF